MTYDEYLKLDMTARNNVLRNKLHGLRAFGFVSISRERDFHVENATGEDNAVWEIEIGTRAKTVRVKSDDLDRAIIEASCQADQLETEAFKETERKRAAALAKLTPDETRLLGLR